MNEPSSSIPIQSPTCPGTVSRGIGLGLGWVLLFGFVGFVAAVGDYHHHVRGFQAAWGVAFVGYALVLRAVWGGSREASRGGWGWWFAGFVLLRLIPLWSTPSDDLYRYVWEGRIQAYGFNPYAHPPLDEALAALRPNDPNWSRINHPDYPAIYPPLSQLLFRLVASWSLSVYVMKAVLVGLEVLALVVLGKWLMALGLPPQRLAVYALNPLVLFSFGVEGHLDPLMLLCLALAGLLAARGRLLACGVAVGLAIAAKLVAIVLLPWLLLRKPGAAVFALVVTAVTYLPYADAGLHLFDSLRRFSGTTILGLTVEPLALVVGAPAARVVGAVTLLLFCGWLALRRRGFAEYATRAFAGLIVVMPVVHVWYLSWFLFFAWARVRFSWLLFSAAMVIYFEAEVHRYRSGTWVMPSWAAGVLLAVLTAGWMTEWLWRRRASFASETPEED